METAKTNINIDNDRNIITISHQTDLCGHAFDIVGNSPAIKKVFNLINHVAPVDTTVIILGETGTGKELVARAIHDNSPRKAKPMVKVNCGALPASLVESELFGHERGSFTGAAERRIGKFELAHNGTLFLDEIGEMPLELQVKLLRVLQEKEIERIGGSKAIKVDVRIIAATNRNLEREVQAGRFRADLYYRLQIFPVHLPALRHRISDIPLLAGYFVRKYAKRIGKPACHLSNNAILQLHRHPWPGNIRELEHVIERSMLLNNGDILDEIYLPDSSGHSLLSNDRQHFVPLTLDENERNHILASLVYCDGKVNGKQGAAQLLGVPPSTLQSKMKRLGIKREHVAYSEHNM